MASLISLYLNMPLSQQAFIYFIIIHIYLFINFISLQHRPQPMRFTYVSSKSLSRQEPSNSNKNQKTAAKNLKKKEYSIDKQANYQKNPEQQQSEIKMLVKQYFKGKNMDSLKTKLLADRLLKKQNNTKVEVKASRQLNKENAGQSKRLNEDSYSLRKHQITLDEYHHDQCQKCKGCTCKNHLCSTNKIRFKANDPVSKFRSNYTIGNREARAKSHLHMQRPQVTASYCSAQLQNLPQYSPRFYSLNYDSSYKAQFSTLNPSDNKPQSFNNLKHSNIKFGLNQVKNYESSYQKQYKLQLAGQNYDKTPQPFVVKQSGNLNALGLKYHSICSSYSKDFQCKKKSTRAPIRPPSLLKDLNLLFVKQSTYRQTYNPKAQQVKTAGQGRQKKQKVPVVHHLSSSFIPLNGVTSNTQFFQSSYNKDYIQNRENGDIKNYSCPHGIKSSKGAASKYY